MKVVLALVVILFLLLIALPMGMGHMGDCPMCTSPDTSLLLAMCAGILSALFLAGLGAGARLGSADEAGHHFLLQRDVYRPPRPL